MSTNNCSSSSMYPETETSGSCVVHGLGHSTIACLFVSAASQQDDCRANCPMSGASLTLQGNEEAKPAEQVTESKSTVNAFKAASTAHAIPAIEDSVDEDQTGMAADVAPAALTDVPTGVHADKAAAAHLAERTGERQYVTCLFNLYLAFLIVSCCLYCCHNMACLQRVAGLRSILQCTPALSALHSPNKGVTSCVWV